MITTAQYYSRLWGDYGSNIDYTVFDNADSTHRDSLVVSDGSPVVILYCKKAVCSPKKG